MRDRKGKYSVYAFVELDLEADSFEDAEAQATIKLQRCTDGFQILGDWSAWTPPTNHPERKTQKEE
jgi:hypothetical protein